MAHMQQQILEAMQAVIIAANTAAGSDVEIDRTEPWPAERVPAVEITTEDSAELVEPLTAHHPHLQQRTFEFEIRCTASGRTAPAESRALGAEVETALIASASDVTLGGLTRTLLLTGVSSLKDGSGEVPVAEQRQKWRAIYVTQSGAPTQPV